MIDASVRWVTDEGEIPAVILMPWNHDGVREWTAHRNDMPGVWAHGRSPDEAASDLAQLIDIIEGA